MEDKLDKKTYAIIEKMIIKYYQDIREIKMMENRINSYEEQGSRFCNEDEIRNIVDKLKKEIDRLKFENETMETALSNIKDKYRQFINLKYGQGHVLSCNEIMNIIFISTSTYTRRNKKAFLSISKNIPTILLENVE